MGSELGTCGRRPGQAGRGNSGLVAGLYYHISLCCLLSDGGRVWWNVLESDYY